MGWGFRSAWRGPAAIGAGQPPHCRGPHCHDVRTLHTAPRPCNNHSRCCSFSHHSLRTGRGSNPGGLPTNLSHNFPPSPGWGSYGRFPFVLGAAVPSVTGVIEFVSNTTHLLTEVLHRYVYHTTCTVGLLFTVLQSLPFVNAWCKVRGFPYL